jgi:nitrogen fixation NifU-like protein
MSDLSDLYQEIILDHNRRPRNYGRLETANRQAVGHNPLCGDRLQLFVTVEEDRISQIAFEGAGCAISKASASLMTEAVRGLSVSDAGRLIDRFQQMVTAPLDVLPDENAMGKLSALAGVRSFPARVKCASLAWHTLRAALTGAQPVATTE